MEWFAFPVDGSDAVPAGAADAAKAAGLTLASLELMSGNRAVFSAGTDAGYNLWQISLAPDPWHVLGIPRQLTFATQTAIPYSVSTTGTVALEVGLYSHDLYFIPLSTATGQAEGPTRRLTHDGRDKVMETFGAGQPDNAYFRPDYQEHPVANYYSIDLETAKQTLVAFNIPNLMRNLTMSTDGRHVAYALAEGDSYSILLVDTGAAASLARVLCKSCGLPYAFSPDGRFLLCDPDRKVTRDPARKQKIGLLDVVSGKGEPWIEDPVDSIAFADSTNVNAGWFIVTLQTPGATGTKGAFLVPWKEGVAASRSEWMKLPLPQAAATLRPWRSSPSSGFIYYFDGTKLMAVHFDPHLSQVSDPFEVKFAAGSTLTPKPGSVWTVRGRGIVFSHEESTNPSVWLMKLPR